MQKINYHMEQGELNLLLPLEGVHVVQGGAYLYPINKVQEVTW